MTDKLCLLFKTFPSVVVAGARQVGKSTLVKHYLGDGVDCVVFDPHTDVENARKDPDLFLNNHRTPLILDEIQYAPEVVSAVKRRLEGNRAPGQYLLTGSQQWSVIKSMAESLAGRTVFLDLSGFSLAEIAGNSAKPWLASWLENPKAYAGLSLVRLPLKNTLYEQLWRGWLPEAQSIPEGTVPDFYQGYLRTYIERDVRQMEEVSDWLLFSRFVRLAAAHTAQEINHSQFGREIGVTPQTAGRWLDTMQGTFQWMEIPAFNNNLVKRISRKPKGYIADTGFACFCQAISSPLGLGAHPLLGALFETAVVAELKKMSALLSPSPNFYQWREHRGSEVDLILEWNGKLYPIEIKIKSHPGREDASGLSAFRKEYHGLKVEPGLILAPAETAYPVTGTDWVLPWDLAG